VPIRRGVSILTPRRPSPALAPALPDVAREPGADQQVRPGRLRRWDAARFPRWLPYLRLRTRFWLAIAISLAWAGFSTYLAIPWIDDLSRALTLPVAIALVSGIAILPGYLNAHLVMAMLLDHPPRLELRKTLPDVALLLAAHHEEACIAETVRYVLASEYPGSFELVVIDDGSTDRTAEIVEEMAQGDDRIRLIRAPHGGKARALNTGLEHVDAEIIATIDADTLLMPQALARIVARLEQSPPDTVAVAGGVLVRNSRDNLLTRMQEWDYFLGIASVKRQQGLQRGTLVAQGAFSVYRTEAVRAVGGWPDMIGEDIVLTWGMLDRGGRTAYEPTAVAFTEVPVTLRAFHRQRERWARGMIEGLRTFGARLLGERRLYSHAIAVNFAFPFIDFTMTVAMLPGIMLAAFGDFEIVGPVTLAVLPLNLLMSSLLLYRQKQVFREVDLRVRRNRRGFLAYLMLYQLVSSPISVMGYGKELLRTRRRW
jgi:biofilm PGA synthesis N-glycosyltransferase PgaC